ncbi:hypothetical protein CTTA_4424 [Comamonas testosteroni]|uniref:Uncharacterized protein n=1 Tax=Comamonas testosteroni TaxID=285 RepID=A0A5A7MKK0_COMTE|nr:hypothetical protein [Comamonas testosteroni]GEQ77419.1 hypothetical protein CTTA_4424 [Comamonas testosteroni]
MAGHFLNGIELPRGMLWVDEFNWSAVQKTVERGITGAQIIDAAARIEGRPITLQAVEDQGWIRRATLQAVQALADVPDGRYPLRLADGREFTVQFAADDPIAAMPISRPELPASTHPYVATLRLITV